MRNRDFRAFSPGQILRNTLIALAMMAVLWWFLADRPLPFGGTSPPARALRDYINAAQRHDCAAVVQAMSARSRELAEAAVAGRSTVERSFCEYSPATAKLPDFETDRIRVQGVSGSTADVSASYTYDRFFGFFGRGRDRYTYAMVLEDGQWRVDLTETLDQESRPNQNRRAMFLAQQTYTAIGSHRRSTGTLSVDPEAIRAEMPGFNFPQIRSGVADAAAPVDTPYVTIGPSVACVSIRSASGTLVLLKIPPADVRPTYQYGAIPSVCDEQPLARPYYGSSSGIH